MLIVSYAEECGHLFVEEAAAGSVGLDPFAVEDELRDRAFAYIGENFIGCAGSGFDVDLVEWDVVLCEEAFGGTAVAAPCRGVNSQFHASILLVLEVNRGEEAGDGIEIGDDRVSHVLQRCSALMSGFRIARAAGVVDEDGDDAEIGGVTTGGLDSYLKRYTRENQAADAAVAQCEREWSAFEGGHGELVEDGFAGKRSELGNELERGRVAQEGRADLRGILLALPGHSHSVLERAHQLQRERHVTSEDGADACAACCIEQRLDLAENGWAVRNLRHYTRLHVVDQKRGALWVHQLLKGGEYLDSFVRRHVCLMSFRNGLVQSQIIVFRGCPFAR